MLVMFQMMTRTSKYIWSHGSFVKFDCYPSYNQQNVDILGIFYKKYQNFSANFGKLGFYKWSGSPLGIPFFYDVTCLILIQIFSLTKKNNYSI